MSDTLERVRKIVIDHLDCDPEKTTEQSHLYNDLGADSLDGIELVMALEEEFDIDISDNEGDGVNTVGDLVVLIDGKKAS